MKTNIQDNKMNRRQKKLNKKQKINCKHKMNKNKKRKLKQIQLMNYILNKENTNNLIKK